MSESAVRLFDVQAGFGGAEPGEPVTVTRDDVLAAQDAAGIDRALVRITPETLDTDVLASNQALYSACNGAGRLVPCPVVMPSGGRDFPAEDELVAAAVEHGAGAAVIRPGVDYWSLARWASDVLFTELEALRLPVLCLERLVTLEQVGDLAGRYPELPLIVAEVSYRMQGVILPLLQSFANVHLSIGNNYSLHRGIEQTVATVGPRQILFGSGFPVAEPLAAVGQLMYAEIDDEAKRLIGSGNLERLIEGIRR